MLDRTVFYPTGGGQPGDSRALRWEGGEIEIVTTVRGDGDDIVLVPAEPAPLPPPAPRWTRRWTGTAVIVTCACTRRCTCCRW